MTQFDTLRNDAGHAMADCSCEALTDYQLAVLSTLYEPNDSQKVDELAQHWGYQQDHLRSYWTDLHQVALSDSQ